MALALLVPRVLAIPSRARSEPPVQARRGRGVVSASPTTHATHALAHSTHDTLASTPYCSHARTHTRTHARTHARTHSATCGPHGAPAVGVRLTGHIRRCGGGAAHVPRARAAELALGSCSSLCWGSLGYVAPGAKGLWSLTGAGRLSHVSEVNYAFLCTHSPRVYRV